MRTRNTYSWLWPLLFCLMDNCYCGLYLLCRCKTLRDSSVQERNKACCEPCHRSTDPVNDKALHFHWWLVHCPCTTWLHGQEATPQSRTQVCRFRLYWNIQLPSRRFRKLLRETMKRNLPVNFSVPGFHTEEIYRKEGDPFMLGNIFESPNVFRPQSSKASADCNADEGSL